MTRLTEKSISFVLIIGMIVCFSGCKSNAIPEKEEQSQEEYATLSGEENLSLDELIELSDVAVVADYIRTVNHEYYTEYLFHVEETLYGDVNDEEIYVYEDKGSSHVDGTSYTYQTGGSTYEQGDRYILVMNKFESIMYEHDRYLRLGDLRLNQSKESFTLDGEALDIDSDELIDHICSVHSKVERETPSEEKPLEASYENEIEEMVQCAKYVGEVKIESLELEGLVSNGNTYCCTVTQLYTGDALNTYEDGTISLVLLKGSVEVGKTYIVGFSPADGENSLLYEQVTKNGVYENNDGEVISQIKQYAADK